MNFNKKQIGIKPSLTVDSMFGDIDRASSKHLTPDGMVWEEDPVDFKTFVESEDFSNLDGLSDKQYEYMNGIIGSDPKKLFSYDKTIREAVLCLGKGSGKDFMCSLLQLYATYVLLCLRDPQGYFNFPSGEPLDCINVARTREQAKTVYFEKLVQRLLGNHWFKENFTIIKEGRKVNITNKVPDRGQINILGGMIQFPKNVRAVSEHSANESYEGKNLILWIMDEASGFKSKSGRENAEPIYQTLTTSTRELPYIGVIISYPRHEEDFTLQKYEYSQSPEGSKFMFGAKATTWEVKPKKFYSGETFKFEIHPGEFVEIPIEYKSQWEKDPEDCKKKYMCIAPKAESPFYEYQEHIDNAVVARDPLILVEDQVVVTGQSKFTVKRIMGLNPAYPETDKKLERMVWVDNGQTSCRATLSIGRKSVNPYTRLIIEQTLVWYPNPERSIQVSLKNIEEVLVWLCRELNVKVVGSDYWNSATAKESIEQMGIHVVRRNLNDTDYSLLKGMIYTKLAEIPDHKDGIDELKKLGKREDGGVMRRNGGFKDIADSWVGCCYLAFGKDNMLRGDIGNVFPTGVLGASIMPSANASNMFGTEKRMNTGLESIKDEMSLMAVLERSSNHNTRNINNMAVSNTPGQKISKGLFPKPIRMRGH